MAPPRHTRSQVAAPLSPAPLAPPHSPSLHLQLSPECLTPLTQEFNADPAPIGVLGSEFLAECAALKESGVAAPSPSGAPANETDMAM